MNSIVKIADSTDEILKDEALDIKVTDMLIRLGIHASFSGYRYLRMGIMIAYRSPGMAQYPTKSLYPRIAKYCGAASSVVERSCRRAIERAYFLQKGGSIAEFFGGRGISDKPTCKEFILVIADYLHMEDVFN